jgi:alpha-L-fucosidase 2
MKLLKLCLLCFLLSCSKKLSINNYNEKIWFNYPGKFWNSQAMHLGNGYFGASFLGGVEEEIIAITDASMWTGAPANGEWEKAGVNPKAITSIPKIREAVVNGNIPKADKLMMEDFMGTSKMYGFFTSIGEIKIEFPNKTEAYTKYKRELNLEKSLVSVAYKKGETSYLREYFCSYPDKVLVLKYTADKKNSVDLNIGSNIIQKTSSVHIKDNVYEIRGFINDNERPFNVLIEVKNDGGVIGRDEDKLTLKGANSAELYITISTNYKMEYPAYVGENPAVKNRDVLDNALENDYTSLKIDHINDYQSLYKRVKLELVTNEKLDKLPTNERFEKLKNGGKDTGYKELVFNLGRYMLISSSRPGTLPANLQGVWNAFKVAPWAGNYQSNVNVQEIYWSSGPLDLLECQKPYIDWIENLSVSGKEIAKRVYGTDGWVSHSIGNIWGHAAPIGGIRWGMYPMGGVWHCQHVWDQYSFNQDKNYLKVQAYPLLKGQATFWLQNLMPYKGYYITSPAVSAEHGALMTKDGLNPAFHDYESEDYQYNLPGVYQDMEMLWDLFTNTAEAAKILHENVFADSLMVAREKLLPLKIGKYGQLQEWYQDIDNPETHHRHIAHLYAVAPGRQIHPTKNPELAKAAKKSLNMRGDGRYMEQEDASGGNWARAHRMWAWTRLMDGERASKIMGELITEQGFENGLTYQHAPYNGNGGPEMQREEDGMHCNWQLDASAALPGCIAEMIVQSHMNEIHLLPALSEELKTGKISGVKARGNYTLDISWKDGELVKAIIKRNNTVIPVIRIKNELIDLEKDSRISLRN